MAWGVYSMLMGSSVSPSPCSHWLSQPDRLQDHAEVEGFGELDPVVEGELEDEPAEASALEERVEEEESHWDRHEDDEEDRARGEERQRGEPPPRAGSTCGGGRPLE